MNDRAIAAPLVLLVGGDAPTHAMLRFLLDGDGYAVAEAANVAAVAALPRARDAVLMVAVVDDRESEIVSTLGSLRRALPQAPALLLARDVTLSLRRYAFSLGIQEVIALPVAPRDLQARLRTALGVRVMKEATPVHSYSEGGSIRAGGLVLRPSERMASDNAGWIVRLTRREVALLHALMASPGRIVGHQDLSDRVWGRRAGSSANALAVYVRRLRAKLTRPQAPHGYVRTVHGQGYVFDARLSPRIAEPRAHDLMEVLVVDDDRATLDMMAEVLRMAGYAVTCGVGPQAPVLARQTTPTVILLDINMPGMNGIEVRRHLRESPRTAMIPVIALSAGGNLRHRAGEMEADDYLAKPFSTDELLLRVEKWSGRASRL